MKAQMRVVVEGDRVVDLAVDPPLGAKVVQGDDGPILYLVNTAASLLEDDDLFVDIRIGTGGRLTVRSVAAQVAHPCLSGGATFLTVRAHVAGGSKLQWWPEPMIVCAQSNHRASAEIEIGCDAEVDWGDEVVLGRSGEDVAVVGFVSDTTVTRDGTLVLEDGLALEPAGAAVWRGPAIVGDARYIGTRLRVGPRSAADAVTESHPGWTTLAGGGLLARVLDVDPLSGRLRLEQVGRTPT